MFNHEFTLREKLLLLLCVLIGLGIFYYEIVYKNFVETLNKYDTDEIQNEIIMAQAQLDQKKQMEKYIADHKNDNRGEIALYNNLANEIAELGRIFEGVDELTIVWSDPTLTKTTVRRDVSISFTVTGYPNVVELIDQLNSNKYRSIISDISITTLRDEILDQSTRTRTNIKMTFYERVDENTNLQGLTILK